MVMAARTVRCWQAVRPDGTDGRETFVVMVKVETRVPVTWTQSAAAQPQPSPAVVVMF